MKTLALTGGIACGKSFFGSILAELGADVLDADDLVRSLHAPGGKAAAMVSEVFGSGFIASDGGTDRAKLSRLVFSDPTARERLESLLHPLVKTSLLSWRDAPASPSGAAVVRVAQIPLLFETGWTDGWGATATVETSDEALRISRLCARGLTESEARARIATQLSSAERASRADFVVRNDADRSALRHLAQILLSSL